MTGVSRDEIERIARLAALDVDSEALSVLTEQIAEILDYVSQLEMVDTGVGLADSVWLGEDQPQPLRADETRSLDAAANPASFAPEFEDNLIVVPMLGAIEDV